MEKIISYIFGSSSPDTSISLDYTSNDGEKIEIPDSLDPFNQLLIDPTTNTSITKKAMVRAMSNNPTRQSRALISLAYHMITTYGKQQDNMYYIKARDIFLFAAIGHKDCVVAEIARDLNLVNSVDRFKRTPLYIAARNGFEDLVELFVQKRANINHRQLNNSTPLHAAAYYGQKSTVDKLLIYGADQNVQNHDGNTPMDEANDDIKKVFDNYRRNSIAETISFFSSTEKTKEPKAINYQNRCIAFEVVRKMDSMDTNTKLQYNRIRDTWEVAYHGTKLKFIKSILTHGLLPSGAELPDGEVINPPPNHISLDQAYSGIQGWSRAIFVSPSILYASEKSYSEHISCGNSRCCVIFKVYVEPSAYKQHQSTLLRQTRPVDSETDNPEYRIHKEVSGRQLRQEHKIPSILSESVESLESFKKKSEVLRNVVVASLLFLDVDFLDKVKMDRFSQIELKTIFK